jgi:membrane protein YqaA with SNARE-associated domain
LAWQDKLGHMPEWMSPILQWLALPEFGLSTVFVVSLVSATLLPLGSEPAVFGLVKLSPDLFWSAIAVATVGNTLGGMVSWWMGWGAQHVVQRIQGEHGGGFHSRALIWLKKMGPRACLLSWLPGIGDPLCAVAGYLKLPAWPCMMYMAVGKALRYVVMTSLLLWVF